MRTPALGDLYKPLNGSDKILVNIIVHKNNNDAHSNSQSVQSLTDSLVKFCSAFMVCPTLCYLFCPDVAQIQLCGGESTWIS